ncbi:MAG: hypothetical protein DRJ50_08745 [Actinobacteria bacterium]|nr:MAG: hypothetical protein DRJ50_08745 [Actinomycetota bacterium]
MADTMTSGNPAFSSTAFKEDVSERAAGTVTVGGTSLKTFVLLAFVIAGGAWGWASSTTTSGVDEVSGYANTTVTIPGGFWIASFGALFVGIWVSMSPRKAAIGGIIYALLEGYVLGAISAMFNAQTEGIVGAAIIATVCVFLAALFLYVTRIIRPTRKMAFGVTAAIGGLCLLYLMVGILAIFNWSWLYSEQFQVVGVVISGLAVILAALSLTLDFAQIERAVEAGAPKYLEWYFGFGLMVTLIWLYITLLRLLSFVARRN